MRSSLSKDLNIMDRLLAKDTGKGKDPRSRGGPGTCTRTRFSHRSGHKGTRAAERRYSHRGAPAGRLALFVLFRFAQPQRSPEGCPSLGESRGQAAHIRGAELAAETTRRPRRYPGLSIHRPFLSLKWPLLLCCSASLLCRRWVRRVRHALLARCRASAHFHAQTTLKRLGYEQLGHTSMSSTLCS